LTAVINDITATEHDCFAYDFDNGRAKHNNYQKVERDPHKRALPLVMEELKGHDWADALDQVERVTCLTKKSVENLQFPTRRSKL
jgi:hypothetical protein